MKILIIGSGGREHALAWKIAQSPLTEKIYCAPGNAGIAEQAECVDIPADNLRELLDFAVKKEISLTVVGPENPLSEGIVDLFMEQGLAVFGPNKAAAKLEASKTFAKDLMKKYNIPTAGYGSFDNYEDAFKFYEELGLPCVIKADGLAAGKGVTVCFEEEEALRALREIFNEKRFGNAGNLAVIEEYLEGQEVSVLAFADGKTILPMVPAQDHKRVFDNDQGPNTGGMGVYSPVPFYTPEIAAYVEKEILEKTLESLKNEGIEYKGVLYAGLMLTPHGPKVLEYNARFGDPETQVILPRLKSDLLPILLAVTEGKLGEQVVEWYEEAAVSVVIASGGYPGEYETEKEISGLEKLTEAVAFHAGSKFLKEKIVTAGGRVIALTALGKDLNMAIEKVYEEIKPISFSGMHYRKDIGKKALI